MSAEKESKELVNDGEEMRCPYCAETVKKTDKACRHCGSTLRGNITEQARRRSVLPAIWASGVGLVLLVALGFFASSYFVSAPACDSHEAKNSLKRIVVEHVWKDLRPLDREWLLANIEFTVSDVIDSSAERFPKERACYAQLTGHPQNGFDRALSKLAEDGEVVGQQAIYGDSKDDAGAAFAAVLLGMYNFEKKFAADLKFEEWKSGLQSLRKVYNADENRIRYPINYVVKAAGENGLLKPANEFYVSTNEAVNYDLEQAASILLFGKQLAENSVERTNPGDVGLGAGQVESVEEYEDIPLID